MFKLDKKFRCYLFLAAIKRNARRAFNQRVGAPQREASARARYSKYVQQVRAALLLHLSQEKFVALFNSLPQENTAQRLALANSAAILILTVRLF